MKRKLTALLTLLVFAGSIFLPQTAAVAIPAGGATYTAVNRTPALHEAAGVVSGMQELRVNNGSDAGVLAYALNATRQMPSAQGTSGYVKMAANGAEDWKRLVDKAQNPATVRQDVLNVIWNGYPYMAGTWKGVSGDPAGLAAKSGLTLAQLTPLYNLAVTQQAIWHYTDNQPIGGPLAEEVKKLVAASKANPAPSNFDLDIYDASGIAAQRTSHLIATSAAQKQAVSIKVTHRWLDASGNLLTGVPTPTLSFALYQGESTEPMAVYGMNDAVGTLAFALFDDEQTYRLEPVLSGQTEGFDVGKAQTFSLKGEQGAVVYLDFTTTYKTDGDVETPAVSVPLGATLSLDGNTPKDGTFTLMLKDEAGNILQTKSNTGANVKFDEIRYDKEGVYTYTISMQAGTDSKIAYDKAVYTVIVNVTRGEALSAVVTYQKDGIVYTGIPAFAGKSVSTPTTPSDKTVDVTVNKVWKNDKSSTRPSSVQMQLYRDGKAYGSKVTLNSANGWKYTWNDLDDDYKWTVNEPSVPSGYTKSVKNSGNNWTITNTAKKSSTTTTTTKSDKNNTSKTDSDKTKNRSTPETGDRSHLRLFGTIAIISLSGMVAIAAIWLLTSRNRLRGKK